MAKKKAKVRYDPFADASWRLPGASPSRPGNGLTKRYVWIRRGYGCFVRCKSEVKARRKACYWLRRDKGDGGEGHPVIGLFVGPSNLPSQAKRTQLFPRLAMLPS